MVPIRPPPLGCLLITLVADYGDDWVKQALQESRGLQWHIKQQAKANVKCAAELERLFPDGLPDPPPKDDPPELAEILKRIRDDPGRPLP